jgi:DNA (cytosine-5)-methyltransferase 1
VLAYYNEHDPYAAQWLRNLIAGGHIAAGDVDERSIEDVRPSDLHGYTQCHFFAGVGVWSYALRRAGWSDDRPVWTGSCPCQPFSAAGKGAGFDDERHLWPAWQHLIKECAPAVVFGEQVASSDAGPWIDLVHDDLEDLGYAFGAIPFPSAGVGAPHIRDRLYWMADASNIGLHGRRPGKASNGRNAARLEPERLRIVGDVADALQSRRTEGRTRPGNGSSTGLCSIGGLADADGWNAGAERQQCRGEQRQQSEDGIAGRVADAELQQRSIASESGDDARGRDEESATTSGLCSDLRAGPTNGFWRDADWLGCTDGKWRPVEPGTFPLAHGATARVGRLRAYGNAINAEAARVFIEAGMSALA